MSAPRSVGISLRRAALSDVGSIRNLARSSYAKWVPVIGREPLPMAADYTRAVLEHMIDLLFIGSELAGLIEMVNKGNYLLIENVAVAPPVQGKGHGRYLLAHAERVAASLGLVELKLYTNKLFERNIEFYSQLGYLIDREVPFMEGVKSFTHDRLTVPALADTAKAAQLLGSDSIFQVGIEIKPSAAI